MQQIAKVALTVAAVAMPLAATALMAADTSLAGPSDTDAEKRNRSRFEYHNGSPEEKRPYRRPDLDTDPTNLKLEELRERVNGLEERLEMLERSMNRTK